MAERISVIVPVYNAEKYLARCLRSLTEQTVFDRLEVLLVDDGSTDASGEMCDRYAAQHPNARVIHKQNGGVSSARNAGLDAATGEYVGFVDGDDFLRPDAMEIALGYLRAGAEGVFLRVARVYDDRQPQLPDVAETMYLEGPEVHRTLLTHCTGVVEDVPKVYRRDVVGDTRFPEQLHIGEDAVFLFRVLCRLRRAVIPSAPLYFYRQNPQSAIQTIRAERLDERVAAHVEVERLTRETWPELAEVARARTLHMRLFILNDMMDRPGIGDDACFRRHLRALRGELGALLRNRERVWMPPERKAYALILCLCPPAARLLHRRRVDRRKGRG